MSKTKQIPVIKKRLWGRWRNGERVRVMGETEMKIKTRYVSVSPGGAKDTKVRLGRPCLVKIHIDV